jgi:hypothetical protein
MGRISGSFLPSPLAGSKGVFHSGVITRLVRVIQISKQVDCRDKPGNDGADKTQFGNQAAEAEKWNGPLTLC